jgi:hypothetical protein
MRRVLVVAALLALTAVLAFGQNVQNMGTWYRNPQSGQVVDASGNAYSLEAAKDRDNIYTATLIADTLHASLYTAKPNILTTAESTIVVPCGQYRRFAIGLRVQAAALDTFALTFAVQIRGHFSAAYDSASTFVWAGWAGVPSTLTTGSDSLSFLGKGSGYTAWPGERIITFKGYRGNALLAQGDFGAPDGLLIDLVDSKGMYFWAPYISIRVRCLTAVNYPRVNLSLAMGS